MSSLVQSEKISEDFKKIDRVVEKTLSKEEEDDINSLNRKTTYENIW